MHYVGNITLKLVQSVVFKVLYNFNQAVHIRLIMISYVLILNRFKSKLITL